MILQDTVYLNVRTSAFQAHLQSESSLSVRTSETPRTSETFGSPSTEGTSRTPQTPPQTFRDLTPLLDTPNKRPFEKGELQQ